MIMGYKFYKIEIKNLFKLSPNMDSLIAIGTSAAVAYGLFEIYKILNGETHYAMHLYFESAAIFSRLCDASFPTDISFLKHSQEPGVTSAG